MTKRSYSFTSMTFVSMLLFAFLLAPIVYGADADFSFETIKNNERVATLWGAVSEKVKEVFEPFKNFVVEKIGINIYDGLTLIGELFIWIFDSLVKVVKWLLTLVS